MTSLFSRFQLLCLLFLEVFTQAWVRFECLNMNLDGLNPQNSTDLDIIFSPLESGIS